MLKTTIVLFILACLYIPVKGEEKTKDEQPVASVGTHEITLGDFHTRYAEYLSSSGVKDNNKVRESVLSNMINEVALYYYDNNRDLFNNKDYKLEQEWSKKQTILAYLKDQEIYAKIQVSDKELREAFLRVNQKIAARHLFAQTEEEADNLYQLLMAGQDFKTLAKQVFTDSTLRNNGGYLGYFTWGDMDPAFEDAAFSLKVGEISKPVKTKYGYSIIKVED